MQFDTPILLIAFNRPKNTQLIFDQIKKIQPSKLYFSVDGPRGNNSDDIIKCKEVKNITKQIDWNCELKTKFSNTNLGCGRGPASGITWFFENEHEGIILEDDMMPDLIFFNYCKSLLEKYRNNKDIHIISGGNIFKSYSKENSYYFSRATRMWGWATWERVWKNFDFDVKCDKIELAKALADFNINATYVRLITNFYSKVFSVDKRSYWDFQVDYMLFINRAINIMPNSHLVGNTGFSEEGTHTKSYSSICEKDIDYSRFFPLKHPLQITVDEECDKTTFRKTYYISPIRVYRGKIKKVLKSILGINK